MVAALKDARAVPSTDGCQLALQDRNEEVAGTAGGLQEAGLE